MIKHGILLGRCARSTTTLAGFVSTILFARRASWADIVSPLNRVPWAGPVVSLFTLPLPRFWFHALTMACW